MIESLSLRLVSGVVALLLVGRSVRRRRINLEYDVFCGIECEEENACDVSPFSTVLSSEEVQEGERKHSKGQMWQL